MANGEVLTEADFERLALEAEATEPDYKAIATRMRAKGGRPSLGEGVSPVMRVRLDEALRQQVAERAEREHTTPSNVVRDAIKAWVQAS